MPGREHVVHPHAEADEADGDERRDDPDVAGERPAREHRDDHRDHAGRGDEEDVHLGMAPEPEQVLVQQRAAAARRARRTRCRRGGRARAAPAAIVTAGTAKITMNENTSIDHTKIGMRLNVIPGARNLKMVTMKFTAPTVVEMPTKMIAEPPEVDVDAGRVRLAGQRHVGEPAAVGRVADERRSSTGRARRAGRSSS